MKQLLSYEESQSEPTLNCGGTTYLLKIKKSYFFGLLNDTYETTYVVPYDHEEKNYTQHWDNMIQTKSKF